MAEVENRTMKIVSDKARKAMLMKSQRELQLLIVLNVYLFEVATIWQQHTA